MACGPGKDNENPFSDFALVTNNKKKDYIFLWFFPSENLKLYLLPTDKRLLRMKTTQRKQNQEIEGKKQINFS